MSKYSLLRHPKKNPKVEPNWRTRGDTLRFFIHSVENRQKIGGALLVKKLKESLNAQKTESQCRKKWLCRNFENVISEHPNFENVISKL